MNEKYTTAGKRLFGSNKIDYKLLRKQKNCLVFLEIHYRDTLKDTETANNLKGLIELLDNIQDIAVDVIGKSEKDVFDLDI